MSTNLSSQPRLAGVWGRIPLQRCRELLTALVEERPEGSSDIDFLLYYMQKRSPRMWGDLPADLRELMKDRGITKANS